MVAMKRRNGRGRGSGHQKWPNKFFAGCGLFCPMTARAQAVLSPAG